MSSTGSKEDDDRTDADSIGDSATNTLLIPEKGDVKMAGYLEKRGKMKLLSTWKRYWFVLEGRLLLYYRSQLEYLNLSACRGSLNMGIASCVRPIPGPGFIMEVVTRTHAITLRTKDRAVQEQWLQALLDSMAHPNISSPMRSNGGPLHFRYSLDNLPTVEEMEQLDSKIGDKQGTLPRQPKPPSLSRRESVLMRIKHLGGRSYGGSLDTVLKQRVGSQVQQPKIPRIKAVDRMVGLQTKHETQDHSDLEESEESTAEQKIKRNEIESENSSIISELAKNEENTHQSLLLQADLQKNHSNGVHIEKSAVKINSTEEISKRPSPDPDLLESLVASENLKKSCEKGEDLEVGKPSDEKDDLVTCGMNNQSSDSISPYVEVENQLYIQSSDEHKSEKFRESLKEISPQLSPLSCNGITSEVAGKMDETSGKEIFEDEEEEYYSNYDATLVTETAEEYYSNYDRASFTKAVENLKINSEPALPPRPSVSSPESPSNPCNLDIVEYNAYYEPEMQPELLSAKAEEKKKKLKLVLRRKKSTKDSVVPENRSNKKKRKISFLRKMLKHYRKKPELDHESDDYDEPEYDTVDYASVVPTSVNAKSMSLAQENVEEEEEEEVFTQKDKVFGTTTLLPKNALQELRLKLKERVDESSKQFADVNKKRTSEDSEKTTNTNLLSEETRLVNDCDGSGSGGDSEMTADIEDRPQLPPRRARRPSSPWHDIPTNNSPVYGNFNFQTDIEDEDCGQEMQDEMLGTPEGYSYLQKKWKAVERSGEWHRELRQVTFPANTRNQGPKLLRGKENEVHVVGHDHHEANKFKSENKKADLVNVDSVDIYSKVNKKSDEESNSVAGVVCSKDFCVKNVNNVETKSERRSNDYIVDNVSYVPYCDFISSNMNFLSVGVETSRDENFQKDSLMTSICTQTESDLDDSIINIPRSESKDSNTGIVDKDVLLSSKCEDCSHAKHCCLMHGHQERLNPINISDINVSSIQRLSSKEKTQSEKIEALSEGTTQVATNRYSDELNQLLAQLAEITSAPLLSPGATKSLIDFPELKTTYTPDLSLSDQIALLGPIRRRRHSEPDYDIPRPHNSIVQIKAFPKNTRLLADVSEDQDRNPEHSPPDEPSEESSITKETDQAQLSWTLSMAPDSLEPVPAKFSETTGKLSS